MVSHKKKTPTNHKLADRDLKLLQLDEEIKNKKNLLLKKRKELEEKKGLNQYLEIVKDDYNKYYEVEVNKKKNELGQIFHYDLQGKRELKYEALNVNSIKTIKILIQNPFCKKIKSV
jgi:hypothetical protein